MNIQTNTWIFQNSVTTTGNGLAFQTGRNNQMTVYVIGSGSFTVVFEGSDSESTPNWYAIPAVKLLDLTVVSSTSTNGAYVIDLAHFVSVRCRISAISGGTVKVVGRIVDVGSTLLSNLLTTVNATVTTPIQTSLLTGTSTSDGTTATLVDSTKNIITDALNSKTIKFTIDTTEYVRTITSSTGSTIGFADTVAAVAASAVIGETGTAEVTVVCVATGDDGNSYTVRAIPAPGTNDNLSAALDGTVITVYLGKTDDALDNSKNTATAVAGVIDQIPEFTATMTGSGGVFPEISTPVEFTGGVDGVIVVSGTEYVVF